MALTPEAWLTLLTIAGCFALLIFSRFPPDAILVAGVTLLLLLNIISPQEVLEQYPVDAARYWAAGSAVGDDLPYSEKGLRAGEKLLRKLWNASKLVDSLTPDERLDQHVVEPLRREERQDQERRADGVAVAGEQQQDERRDAVHPGDLARSRNGFEPTVGYVSAVGDPSEQKHPRQDAAGEQPKHPPRSLGVRGQKSAQRLNGVVGDDGVAGQNEPDDRPDRECIHARLGHAYQQPLQLV